MKVSMQDENAQDAIGAILDDGANGDIIFHYDDEAPRISATLKPELNLATQEFVGEAVAGISPAGIFAPRRISEPEDDEFDGAELDPKWTKAGSAALESYDDVIRSAAYFEHAGGSADVGLTQLFESEEDFSFTLLCQLNASAQYNNVTLYLSDAAIQNVAEVQALFAGANLQVRSVKFVSGVFNQMSASPVLNPLDYPQLFLRIQRRSGLWDFYYSHNGINWTGLNAGASIPFTVEKLRITFGCGGSASKTRTVLHWVRKDWLSLL